jgi:hypothetical protein
MGDAGEGLVDAESRIQERLEEKERERTERRQEIPHDPARMQARESLRLARVELEKQLEATSNERRRTQIQQALAEIEKRAASLA